MRKTILSEPVPLADAPHTVGIVEDDAAICDSLQFLLRTRGIAAQCYKSAAEFLNSPDIDRLGALVVDQQMPNMTGIELLELLRSRRIATPAVMITGGMDHTLLARAKKAGALAVLHKPLIGAELIGWLQLGFIAANRDGASPHPTTQ